MSTPLKEALAAAGMNQAELARKTKLGEGQISQIVKGLRVPQDHNRKSIVRQLKRAGVTTTAEELWPDA